MKYLLPALAGLWLAPAALAQTTAPTPQASPAPQTAAPASGSQDVATPATPAPAPAAAVPAAPATPTPGATVYGIGGTPVGTIKSADAQFITLTTAKGDIRIPANGVGPGPNGLAVGMTAAQLEAAAVQAEAGQAPTTPAANTAPASDTPAKPAHHARKR